MREGGRQNDDVTSAFSIWSSIDGEKVDLKEKDPDHAE
jgi:hypothetical protein